jgi:hypothetical protein
MVPISPDRYCTRMVERSSTHDLAWPRNLLAERGKSFLMIADVHVQKSLVATARPSDCRADPGRPCSFHTMSRHVFWLASPRGPSDCLCGWEARRTRLITRGPIKQGCYALNRSLTRRSGAQWSERCCISVFIPGRSFEIIPSLGLKHCCADLRLFAERRETIANVAGGCSAHPLLTIPLS